MAAENKNSSDEICTCLPLRPIIAIVAFVSLIVGANHIITIAFAMEFDSLSEWADVDFKQHPCQGSACHEAQVEQLLSCQGNKGTTYKIRYTVVGILGLIFGWVGFSGCLTRNSAMVRTFAVYLFFLAIFVAAICALDQLYVFTCDKLSENMQKDIGPWIPWETLGIMYAQGHKDLSAFKADKLKEVLGYDFLPVIASCYIAVILFILYFSSASYSLSHVIEAGPAGLGPNYLISDDAARDVTQMKDRLMQVVYNETMHPVRHYEAFGRLEDGNRFPYTSFRDTDAALNLPAHPNYGTLGAEMPLPKPKESQK